MDRGKDQFIFLKYITKPLLIPFLLIFYLLGNNSISIFIILALVFCFLGDVFLLIQTSNKAKKWLILGLAVFLVGHLFYIIAFIFSAGNFSHHLQWSIFLALPFLIVALIIQPILTKERGNLTFAVTIYIVIISFMGISTTFLLGFGSFVGFLLMYIGAWLFSISDALNGYRRFVKSFQYKNFLIMFSYILGQFLLVFGFSSL